ncbi:Crp/Fnr family transcriptional regulator [Jiella pelagia]
MTEHRLIRKLEHYTRLSVDDRRALAEVCGARQRRFGPREMIIAEGERPQAIRLFIDGWGCRHKDLEDGRRQIISLFIPGDMCDVNLFILGEMDHSIAAVSSVTLAEITREAFETLMDRHPRVTQALWWETLVGAAVQREWTTSLGQRDAKERISHLLCELFTRLSSVGLTTDNSCPLPLSQAEARRSHRPHHGQRQPGAAGSAPRRHHRVEKQDLDHTRSAGIEAGCAVQCELPASWKGGLSSRCQSVGGEQVSGQTRRTVW